MELNISESDLDQIFLALAHPTRRQLLERMADQGEARVTELAGGFDVSLNQVSKHLKILERAGLMRRRQEGREHYCSADLRAVLNARSWIDAYATFWRASLRGLETFLDEEADAQSHAQESQE